MILGRLVAMLPDGKVTPEAILKLTPAKMRKAGLSKQKTAYIRDLARKTMRATSSLRRLPDLPDHEVIEHLTQVKGIGVWTAHMFLIFALRRPDILATGDLGVRVAIRKAYQLEELPHPKQVEELAAALAAVFLGGDLVFVAQPGQHRPDLIPLANARGSASVPSRDRQGAVF